METEDRAELLRQIGSALPVRSGYRLLAPPEQWAALGDLLVRQGRLEHSLSAFKQAIAFDADHRYIRAAASILAMLERFDEAIDLLEDFPTSPDLRSAKASLLLSRGDYAGCMLACDQALELDLKCFDARLNRGVALRALAKFEEAVANDRQLVATHPNHPVALYNLGDALLTIRAFSSSLEVLEKSCQIAPDYIPAQMARGVVLSLLARFDEASTVFQSAKIKDAVSARAYFEQVARTLNLRNTDQIPDDPVGIYLASAACEQTFCDWRNRSSFENLLIQISQYESKDRWGLSSLAHTALLLDLPHIVQRTIAEVSAQRARQKSALWASPPERYDCSVRGIKSAQRRLRIGFLSPDFRPHPVVECHRRQIQLHDRRRYEIFAYSLFDAGPSDARRQIIDASDHFVELSDIPPEEIPSRIAADKIDILIDISGYTDYTRPEVLAKRPAPIQVQYMGSPGPSGSDFVDYRITDSIVTPEIEAKDWNEKLTWLPTTFWICDDQLTVGTVPRRDECNLPDDAFVFCCFNSHHKHEPASFDIWMRLLIRLPDSVLWLIDGTEKSRSNLRSEAERRGVSSERLIFAPVVSMSENLARHACADLFLDTFACNAHTTAYISLRGGLPVLTCYGNTMASRLRASITNAAGLPDMIVFDHANYEERAYHLATHPHELAAIRKRLAESQLTAPIFQTEQRVRHIEKAFEIMWQRHAAGLAPESFAVEP